MNRNFWGPRICLVNHRLVPRSFSAGFIGKTLRRSADNASYFPEAAIGSSSGRLKTPAVDFFHLEGIHVDPIHASDFDSRQFYAGIAIRLLSVFSHSSSRKSTRSRRVFLSSLSEERIEGLVNSAG